VELDINAERLSLIITLAREYDEDLPSDDDEDDENHVGEAIDEELVEEHEYDLAYQELKGALESLSRDEQNCVVALVWLGRGTYDQDEFEDALSEASELDAARIPDYLIGTPLLPEYLEEGMTKMGLELEEI
jgi:hypothetical protein